MIGISANSGIARSRRVASSPSITGITLSISTRSGCSVRACSSASLAVVGLEHLEAQRPSSSTSIARFAGHVVDHQHPACAAPRSRSARGRRGAAASTPGTTTGSSQIEPERGCPGPARLSHLDVAAHQPHQLPADGQAQAGAACAALRVARLLERLEDRSSCSSARCRCRCPPPRSAGAPRPAGARRVARAASRCPRSVNLTALSSRLSSTWRRRFSSACTTGRQVGRDGS